MNTSCIDYTEGVNTISTITIDVLGAEPALPLKPLDQLNEHSPTWYIYVALVDAEPDSLRRVRLFEVLPHFKDPEVSLDSRVALTARVIARDHLDDLGTYDGVYVIGHDWLSIIAGAVISGELGLSMSVDPGNVLSDLVRNEMTALEEALCLP